MKQFVLCWEIHSSFYQMQHCSTSSHSWLQLYTFLYLYILRFTFLLATWDILGHRISYYETRTWFCCRLIWKCKKGLITRGWQIPQRGHIKIKNSRSTFTVDLKGHKFSSSTFFPPVRNELLPLVSNYWHLMPPITSTFEAFSSGQRHSRCVYSARKKTKLTRSPISNLRGDLGGSCGDREVLNLLQNLLLLPLLTCRLVGLEVKARMGILSLKMKETKFCQPFNTEHYSQRFVWDLSERQMPSGWDHGRLEHLKNTL